MAPVVASAAAVGARLVVLTEMFASGFSARTEVIAEPHDGPTVHWMRDLATAHRVWLVGSVCELPAGVTDGPDVRPANVCMVVGPDGSVQRYAKRHLFAYAGEHERMAAGEPTLVVDIDGLRTAVFVCYDLRFADDFWRLAPDVDAYVVVANWPESRREHWRALLVARAIENQAWVVGSNRVGRGGTIDYSGDSLVVDPLGTVVADGAGGDPQVLSATLDPALVAEVRARYPFLADRR
jgi:predicted amidohydrolase